MAATSPDPISQRFMQLIQQFGLTKNSFAVSLGKTASVVQHLIEGRNKPGYDLLCRVFDVYPNVSRDWLLLGRGLMLLSGEVAPKLVPPPARPAPQLPLEPLGADDLELEIPPLRRAGPGVAGTRLQPADIAATLALAAATAQPARAAAQGPNGVPGVAAAPSPNGQRSDQTSTGPEPLPTAAMAPSPVVAAALPLAGTATGAPADGALAALLNTQYLQHQLALAELRNQHLMEQQQLLREMLDMARRGV